MSLITLEPNYKPSAKEEYMNEKQLEYFRQKLLNWRAELVKESSDTLQDLKETNLNEPDLNDRASNEADQYLELRTRDRMRKLIKKIIDLINVVWYTLEINQFRSFHIWV